MKIQSNFSSTKLHGSHSRKNTVLGRHEARVLFPMLLFQASGQVGFNFSHFGLQIAQQWENSGSRIFLLVKWRFRLSYSQFWNHRHISWVSKVFILPFKWANPFIYSSINFFSQINRNSWFVEQELNLDASYPLLTLLTLHSTPGYLNSCEQWWRN